MTTPFFHTDLSRMNMTEDVQAVVAHLAYPQALEFLSAEGLCKTMLTPDGQKILGIIAAVPFAEDTCEVTVLSTEDQRDHPTLFARTVRRELAVIRGRFAKIQAISRKEDPKARRFLEWLGFEYDGNVSRPEFKGESRMMWRLKHEC